MTRWECESVKFAWHAVRNQLLRSQATRFEAASLLQILAISIALCKRS